MFEEGDPLVGDDLGGDAEAGPARAADDAPEDVPPAVRIRAPSSLGLTVLLDASVREVEFQMAFMLEEVEVTQLLDLRVVNRVLPRRVGMGKSVARHKINSNRQPSLACIERDGLHEPRRIDAKGCLKQLVGHERCCPHPPSRPIGRSDRATAQSSGRRVNRQPPRSSACGFDGRRCAPPTTPQAQTPQEDSLKM